MSYSARGYKLTKEEYNYLLPVLRHKLLCSNDNYSFVGSSDDLADMLDRLKGCYDYYNELNSMTAYKCFTASSLAPFRKEIGVAA